MADIGTLLTIAQTLFDTLQRSHELKKMCSIWGYKSKLQDLEDTISTIQKGLADAEEAKQALSSEAWEWITKLKDAVYDADDLFDEYLTLAELNSDQQHPSKGRKFTTKVHRFFSSGNQLSVAYRMSQGVDNIRKRLDSIVSNHNKFGFTVDHQPVRRRREETCSYVYTPDVVGREDDLRIVLNTLLDSHYYDEEFCRILSVVGVGGVGKTTLAQLVYNHEKVKSEFELKMWVCVSDQDGEDLYVKAVLEKILESATCKSDHDGLRMDLLQRCLHEELGGKKYLLVLDDMWTEDRYKWLELRKFLMFGGRGSQILVTTRSQQTARVIGSECTHELQGLSDEKSWQLFEMVAFDKAHDQAKSHELAELGKSIVQRCANVPLAIKVVGSLLFGQGASKWRSFQEIGLAKIGNGDNAIMSILMLSYHNLEPPLKTCFSYCALFPKDFVIEKEMLVSLWMAQGYVVPLDGGQSIEDAGEEYFSILLRRCFFQDIKKDQYGEVLSCKIHDLMHDLAEEVAGKEIWVGTCITSALERKSRHLFHVGSQCTESSFIRNMKVRSYLRNKWVCTFPLHSLVANSMSSLRTLDLHNLNIKGLPDSIGKLLHLRYLDLSNNTILARLPVTITRLHNLQTLKLVGCHGFEELPNDLCKLAKLRHLDISHCRRLTHMPPSFDKLTCLQVLTDFVVANDGTKKQRVGKLKELNALKNLRGSIRISIPEDTSDVGGSDSGGGYLTSMQQLKAVSIDFQLDRYQANADLQNYHEVLLEKMQPHSTVKGLILSGYRGALIPRWGRAEDDWAAFLPNLVKIEIRNCERLQCLPLLSRLPFLKSLRLHDLSKLEYMENASNMSSSSGNESVFFPSLEELNLDRLPNLKGWSKQNDESSNSSSSSSRQSQLSFPRLLRLVIRWCPSLTSFPPCPSVETLCLKKLNENMRMMMVEDTIRFGPSSSRAVGSLSDIRNSHSLKLTEVEIDNADYLKFLPTVNLTSIKICSDEKLNNVSELEEVFKSCSSVRHLTIFSCLSLSSLSGGLDHLTALESLSIRRNPNLSLSEENGDGVPWRSLQNLCFLELKELENLVILPEGMQYLTTLRFLTLDSCWNLKALPEWISCLSSLQMIRIKSCYHLKSVSEVMETCQDPKRKGLPNIQHISSVSIVHD